MKSIRDLDVKNKKVLLRVDYNCPIENNKVVDNNRIVSSLDTINYLINENASIILMSHLGKVESKEDKVKNTLLPVKEELEKLLKREIKFSEELKGKKLEKMVNELTPGDILMLENTRHMDYPKELESRCDEELSKYWASLADVFVLDAFASSHRTHVSTYGVSKLLPRGVGFLIEKEIEELNKIMKEEKILILGGAKVSDKIGVIENLLSTTSKVFVGGAMCATFLKAAGYNTGKTFVDEAKLPKIKKLLLTKKIAYPIDVVTENGIKEITEIEDDESILDIGPKTINMYTRNLKSKNLIVMNGTMGKFEDKRFENGTKKLFEYMSVKKYKVVVLGGDTGSATKKYKFTPYYLSTGGGAALEYLEGRDLLPLKIMK